jgi:glycosyltransferase involved in cell wall biosynthesis
MAAVNAAVRDRLIETGAKVLVLDVAASSLDRGMSQRLGRLPRVLQGLVRLFSLRGVEGKPLYMSVSGGLGQVYELFFLVVARVKRMRVVLHHHSFAYLDRPSHLTNALILFAGANALHVVLSQGMGRRLTARYPGVGEVIVLTNAAMLLDGSADETGTSVRNMLCTVGFLSNLSAEKGVFEFLDVIAAAGKAGLPLQARLAGPFQDAETERRVRAYLQELTNVEYVGPQYGETKTRFYQGIDVLLFPTRYRNEAEPLVVLEAMREGLPVIAYGRGAIAEYVDGTCGHVVPAEGNFVDESLWVLRKWCEEPELLQEASKTARQRFLDVLSDGLVSWKRLEKVLRTGNDDISVGR